MSSSEVENPGNPLYEWLENNGLEMIYSKFNENSINLEKSHLIDIDPKDLDSLCQELHLTTEERIKFKRIVRTLNNEANIRRNNFNSNMNNNNNHIGSNSNGDSNNNHIKSNNRIDIIGRPNKIDYKLKVVLVGDSATGKTSLIQKYIKNEFQNDYISTIGIDFGTKTILTPDNENVQLQIWDTCGQERFDSVSQQYFRGAHCVLIVYDVSQRSSFNCIEKRWIEQIKDTISNAAFVIIVGNKLDKRNEFENKLKLKYGKNKNSNKNDSNDTLNETANGATNDTATTPETQDGNETDNEESESKSSETYETIDINPNNNDIIITSNIGDTRNEKMNEKNDFYESEEQREETEELYLKQLRKRFVMSEEGLNLANKYSYSFCETSAKSGHHIPSLFLMCAVNALENREELGLINLNNQNNNNNNNNNNENGRDMMHHQREGSRIRLNQPNMRAPGRYQRHQNHRNVYDFCGC